MKSIQILNINIISFFCLKLKQINLGIEKKNLKLSREHLLKKMNYWDPFLMFKLQWKELKKDKYGQINLFYSMKFH